MKSLDTTAYNETLIEHIQKLQKLVRGYLSTENVNTLPAYLIHRIKRAKYIWSQDACVNGIDTSKVFNMINFLNTYNYGYMFIKTGYTNATVTSSEEDVLKHDAIFIKIPEQYDGRNSFTFVGDGSQNRGASGFGNDGDGEGGNRNTFLVTPRKNDIKVTFRGRRVLGLTLYTLLWRNK